MKRHINYTSPKKVSRLVANIMQDIFIAMLTKAAIDIF